MYSYTTFNGVNLPTLSPTLKIGSMDTANSVVTVGGGGIVDTLGGDDAPSQPKTVTMTAGLLADSKAELETAFQALQAQRGKVGTLVRLWDDSGDTHAIEARLLRVNATAGYWSNSQAKAVQMVWQLLGDVWDGEARDISTVFNDSGDTSYSHTFTIENSGLATVKKILFHFDLDLVPPGEGVDPVQIITNSRLQKTSGKTCDVEIDARMGADLLNPTDVAGLAYTVNTNNSTAETDLSENIYPFLNLLENHKSEHWIALESGTNSFSYDYETEYTAEQNITLRFEFNDGWQ